MYSSHRRLWVLYQGVVHGESLVGRAAFCIKLSLAEIVPHLQYAAYRFRGRRGERRLISPAATEEAHDRLPGLLLAAQQRLSRLFRPLFSQFQLK